MAYTSCKSQYKDAVEFGLTQVDTVQRTAEQYPEVFEMASTAEGKILTLDACS